MEAEELVLSMLEAEHELESPTVRDDREALELEQDYDPLDRRLLSVRLQEYCPTAPEYTDDLTAEAIRDTKEWESKLERSSDADRETGTILLEYDHLKLDHSIAIFNFNTAHGDDSVDNTQLDEIYQTITKSAAAVTSFEVAHPEVHSPRPD